MINQSDISIIIPHLGTTREQEFSLDHCLQSLLETGNFNIFIVRNGIGECKHPYAISISGQGQCKAVNAAAAIINTPWIFVTNDDMIYPPGWFENLTKELTDQICVSPQLVEPRDGAPTFIKYFCGGAGGDFDKQKWLGMAKIHSNGFTPKGLRTGFNLPFLIKKELWDIIGGYDINYDPWGSNGDSDLQAKIHLAGVQPYQNTNSIVYHFSQTSGTSHHDRRSFWQKNWDYFIEKWGFERQSSPDVWNSVNIINYEKLKYHPWWEEGKDYRICKG